VADRAASYIVADILSDRLARSVTFGLQSPLTPRFWTAVKTGTSKDMRDNWCVGFSSRYTVGVWVGNFDGSPMWDVSGVTGAAPLWLEVMSYLHQGVGSQPPPEPPGVERGLVTFDQALEPEREELFMTGTAVSRVIPKDESPAHAGIAYPSAGQVIAVDPDIPQEAQRVHFQATGLAGPAQWRLNGEALASAGAGAFWSPRPGRFQLSLHDAGGTELDRVEFEVRGSPVHARP